MLKKVKCLFFLVISLFCSLSIYKNYIFYKIPYNPLVQLSTNSPTSFYFDLNTPDGETLSKSSHKLEDTALIFKYFNELHLIPLKEKKHREEIHGDLASSYYSCGFKFNDLKQNFIFINEIYLDDLTILSIRSDIPKIKNGYYKIIDSKFDYKYINSILNN